MEIRTLGIVGAGQMGAGIAHVAAASGFDVILTDIESGVLESGVETIDRNLDRQIKKGAVDGAAKSGIIDRITTSTHVDEHRRADLVIESAVESLSIKSEIFRQLDELCPAATILASNTSSISITRLAAVTGRPDRVIGMHFMNPVPIMKLVEIICGQATSDETLATVTRIAEDLGKVPVTVQDYPGFIANRVLMPMINEAVYCLMEGVADREAIDTVMKLGMAHPMGPLTLADFIGLDICLDIMEVLYDGFGDSKYRPCPLLRRMVDAGYLGRKSGRGFYDYG